MKEFIEKIIRWVDDNKEWLFSGVGITFIGWILVNVNKDKDKDKDKEIVSDQRKSINVNDQIKKSEEIINHEVNNGIYEMVDRFISIYESHEVLINQISSFVDMSFNLKISDFKDKDSILNILSDSLLDWTCDTFGVKRDWIDGRDKRKYISRNYYKRVHTFLELLVELNKQYKNELNVYMFKNGHLNPNKYGRTFVMFLFQIPIKPINGHMVYKYIPITTNWDWGYWRTRYQIKSIIYFMNRLNINIDGYDLSDDYTQLAGGYVFPETVTNKLLLGYTWYPEDYIYFSTQSIQAKETDETGKIKEYIIDEGYQDYFNTLMSCG